MAFLGVSTALHSHSFLTDPCLQNPTSDSIDVVWFTEFEGNKHYVKYGPELDKKVAAQTVKLSCIREDVKGGEGCKERIIYRHKATLTNLLSLYRTPYKVVSSVLENKKITSDVFSCAPLPQKGTSLTILLTSDHQLKPMVAANLQKVKELFPDIDAVFFAGDAVNHPDKGSEWFDDPKGNSFFPCLQGRASHLLENTLYKGGAIIQFAPLFPSVGNHEVMGRWDMRKTIEYQFNDPYPEKEAEKEYERLFPHLNDPKGRCKWIKNHSFNTDSYREILGFPPDNEKNYYAVSFGDVRLVSLVGTRIWRSPGVDKKGKYTEHPESNDNPLEWGYGDFIFEPLEKGSVQYKWLEEELKSAAFQNAKYKIVMLHNPFHSLGENSIPPFSHPIQRIEKNGKEKVTRVTYSYPKQEDILIRDIDPLLKQYGVQLVLYGHTHIWNRFQAEEGMHYLETSNVGNSYGVYVDGSMRGLLPKEESSDYVAFGDPGGLEPICPTIRPLKDEQGKPLPFVSSNTITVFSIFRTATGVIDSYYFDTLKPESEIVHFDQFSITGALQREPSSELLSAGRDVP